MSSYSSDLAIEAQGLRKVFGRKVAVEDLTLGVGRGEVFGFLGLNGAGKTTAVKMLLGLIQPTAGWARVLGRPLGDLVVKAKVGFLPEHFRFHDWLQADELLRFHGELSGMSSEQLKRRIPEALELVGLRIQAKEKLRTFSKGMLQRIGIAQALVHRPSVVFLDEPTTALDPLGRREIRDVIKNLKAEGVTIFLNSHLLTEVERVCDRVAIINRGQVVREGLLNQLLTSELQVEARLGNMTPTLLEQLRRLGTVISSTDSTIVIQLEEEGIIPQVAEAICVHGGQLYQLTTKHASLEELFVSAVQGEHTL